MPSERITVDGGGSSRIVLLDRRQVVELVEQEIVVQRQGRQLDDVDLDARPVNGSSARYDLVAFHREQADLGLQGEAFLLGAAAHPLIVPDDVGQIERDLLPGFVADDVGNLLRLDRRELDEPRQAVLAGHADRHPIAADRVARQKLLQRVADQFGGIGAGLAEDLRIGDEVEGVGDESLSAARRVGSAAP